MSDTESLFTTENIMLSDGSTNTANSIAAELAVNTGHDVGYLIYPGMGISDHPYNVFEIGLDQLKESNTYLMRANKSMHRSWPRQNTAHDNALCRDAWLVKWSQTVYMIGLFTQDASLLKINTDAAWAAQMYIDKFIYDQEPMELCNLYMFDTKSEAWYKWDKQWIRVYDVPAAQGVYTVLGYDKPTNAAKLAIRDLWPGVSL